MKSFVNSPSVRLGFSVVLPLALLAPYLGCGPAKQAPPQLSDSQAIEIIQTQWKEWSSFRVHLGTFEITEDELDLSKQRLPRATLDSYKAWEEVGLIKIKTQKNLSEGFTGWSDWNKLFTEGVQSVVYIYPTERGKPMGAEVKDPDIGPSLLLIPQGDRAIDKVIKNEPVRIGLDEYRVVFGTYTTDYTPEARAYYEKSSRAIERENRFKAVLEFDPFLTKWRFLISDEAGLNQGFRTDSVNFFLKQISERSPVLPRS